jgi:hypothetical protein
MKGLDALNVDLNTLDIVVFKFPTTSYCISEFIFDASVQTIQSSTTACLRIKQCDKTCLLLTAGREHNVLVKQSETCLIETHCQLRFPVVKCGGDTWQLCRRHGTDFPLCAITGSDVAFPSPSGTAAECLHSPSFEFLHLPALNKKFYLVNIHKLLKKASRQITFKRRVAPSCVMSCWL